MTSSGLDQEQAQRLQRAFGLEDVHRSESGAVSFADEQRYQYLPTVDKGQGRPDEDGNDTTQTALDTEALKRIRTISTEEAAKRAQEGLRSAGVLPDNASPAAQHTTFQLGGIPLEGEGANIRVSFDAQGVTAVSHAARTYDKAGTVKVNDLAHGAKLCQRYLGAEVKAEAGYVYVAAPLEEKADRVEPSFRCSGRNADGGAPQAITLPAAVGAELPQPGPGQEPRPEAQLEAQAAGTQVGSEGTGVCSGLPNTAANIGTFNTEAGNHGSPRRSAGRPWACTCRRAVGRATTTTTSGARAPSGPTTPRPAGSGGSPAPAGDDDPLETKPGDLLVAGLHRFAGLPDGIRSTGRNGCPPL